MNKGYYRDYRVYDINGKTVKKYDILNRLDLWPNANQEVYFEIINGQALIKELGHTLPYDEVNRFLGINK